MTTSTSPDEKMVIVCNEIRSILDRPYTGQDEGFEVSRSRDSYWKFFQAVVAYCYDITDRINLSCKLHGPTASSPFFRDFVSRQESESMGCI